MTNKFKPKVQVENSLLNYFPQNLKLGQFDNYTYQINDVFSTNPKKVLIIGDGTGIVKYYLQKSGIEVKTMDIDPVLEPNYLGSVHEIEKFDFKDKEFDTILASHVLEHIPFEYIDNALKEFQRISKYSIIHLPYARLGVGFMIDLPFIGKKYFRLDLPIFFWKKYKFNGQHYWELGTKGYSVKSFKKMLEKHFDVIKDYSQKNTHYGYNFICKSKV